MVTRKNRKADCHPDRKHYAKGKCQECYNASRYAQNPEKWKQRKRQWRIENPGRDAEVARLRYVETREKLREYKRTWRLKNIQAQLKRERARRAKNPSRYRATFSKWQRANTDKCRAIANRRRARLRDGRSVGVSSENFREMCEASGWRCWYCLVFSKVLQREHIVPISRGGQDELFNVVPACASCNARKGSKLLSEWLET
jgi:5-methylcytosine-specific restriction endonuclease McrA